MGVLFLCNNLRFFYLDCGKLPYLALLSQASCLACGKLLRPLSTPVPSQLPTCVASHPQKLMMINNDPISPTNNFIADLIFILEQANNVILRCSRR